MAKEVDGRGCTPDRAPAVISGLLGERWAGSADGQEKALSTLDEADWADWLDCARRHRVTQLLHRALAGRDGVPERIQTAMSVDYRTTGRMNLLLLRALGVVLERLREAHIEVMVTKGAALALSVYGDICLRPMGDVDLVVDHADARRALSVLAELGFEPESIDLCPGYAIDFTDQVALRHTDLGAVVLDLQWYLLDPLRYRPPVPADWLWSDAVPVEVEGTRAWVPSAEAQIVQLCAHVWKHRGEGEFLLLWLYDIALLVEVSRDSLDWPKVVGLAAQHGLANAVGEVLRLVWEEWRPPIPEKLWQRLAGSGARPVRRCRYSLDHVYGLGARARALRCKLFPSISYMRRRYQVRGVGVLGAYGARLLGVVSQVWSN